MTTEKQIHFIGEFATYLITLGAAYLGLRMIEGASYQPMFAMSPLVRVVGLLLLVAAVIPGARV